MMHHRAVLVMIHTCWYIRLPPSGPIAPFRLRPVHVFRYQERKKN